MKDSNFYKENGKKGALVNKQNKIKEYNDNPNYCLYCGQKIEIKDGEIPSRTRKRKYCSNECSSRCQSDRMKNNKLALKYEKTFCLNCGKELSKHQSKYCNNACQTEYQYKQYVKKWKSGLENGLKGSYQLSKHIVRYIKEKYNNKCCKCGWCEVNPTTGNIPLEVHHIDGDYTNNNENNLELLCPNCHAKTSSYRGKNCSK